MNRNLILILTFGLFLGLYGYSYAAYSLSGGGVFAIGDNYCWSVSGDISGLSTIWNGTKNGVKDLPLQGGVNVPGPLTNGSSQCYTFKSGEEGIYTRFLTILDANNNVIDQSNTVQITVQLPSFVLSGTAPSAVVGQQICWRVTGNISGLSSIWRGTKNSQPDLPLSGNVEVPGPAVNGGLQCYTLKPGEEGGYERYLFIEQNGNKFAYRTNSLYITVLAPNTNSNQNQNTTSNTTTSNTATNNTTNSTTNNTTNNTTNGNTNTSNASNNNSRPYPNPIISLIANPTVIKKGEKTTLSWNTENAWYCTASDGWGGTKSLTGGQSLILTESTTFELLCGNPDGQVSKSVYVQVVDDENTGNNGIIFTSNNPLKFQAVCSVFPENALTGSPVTFAAGQSAGKTPVKYYWTGDIANGENQTRTVYFSSPGKKTVKLFVTDANNNVATSECYANITSAPVAVNKIIPPPSQVSNSSGDEEGEFFGVPLLLEEDQIEENNTSAASLVPFSLGNISFIGVYLFFLTLILLGLIGYLIYLKRQERYPRIA